LANLNPSFKNNVSQQSTAAAPSHTGNSSTQMQAILQKGLRSSSEPAHQPLKKSDSTASFKEGLRQRAAFTVVMKSTMLPK